MPTRAISSALRLRHPTDGGGELLGCPGGQCCIANTTVQMLRENGWIVDPFLKLVFSIILKHCANKTRSWIAKQICRIPRFNLVAAVHLFSGAAWRTGWDSQLGSSQAKQHSKFQIRNLQIHKKSSRNHLKSRLQMIGCPVGAGFYVSKGALQSVERSCMDL